MSVYPHLAWVEIDGDTYPVTSGSVSQSATKKSATFSGSLALSIPGLLEKLASLGENKTSVTVVSKGQTKKLVTGEIDSVSFDMITGTAEISGRCESAKLHSMKSSEKFTNKKNSDVVSELAKKAGLKADVSKSAIDAGKYVDIDWSKITDGVSLSSVIHKIAEMEGARWWVSDGTLHFKTDDADSAYVYEYSPGLPKSATLLHLKIHRNIQAGKTVKVGVKSWNPRKKQSYVSNKELSGVGGTTVFAYHVPGLNKQHADKHAESKAKEHGKHELEIHIEDAGDPSIDVAMKLRLRGTGSFDQDYEIQSISHKFGIGGHKMTISAKSAKAGRTVKDSDSGESSSKSPYKKQTPSNTKISDNVKNYSSNIG